MSSKEYHIIVRPFDELMTLLESGRTVFGKKNCHSSTYVEELTNCFLKRNCHLSTLMGLNTVEVDKPFLEKETAIRRLFGIKQQTNCFSEEKLPFVDF